MEEDYSRQEGQNFSVWQQNKSTQNLAMKNQKFAPVEPETSKRDGRGILNRYGRSIDGLDVRVSERSPYQKRLSQSPQLIKSGNQAGGEQLVSS